MVTAFRTAWPGVLEARGVEGTGTRKKAREKCRGWGKGRDTGGEIGDVPKRRAGRNDSQRSEEKGHPGMRDQHREGQGGESNPIIKHISWAKNCTSNGPLVG